MIFQIHQLVARQFVLLVEIDLAGEDAVEFRRIGPLDGEHGVVERLAELREVGTPADVSSQSESAGTTNGRDFFCIAGSLRQFVAQVLSQLADGFLEDVADAFEEEQREDIAAKLGVIDVAAQNVGGLFQKGIQFRLGHSAERNRNGSYFFRHDFVRTYQVLNTFARC